MIVVTRLLWNVSRSLSLDTVMFMWIVFFSRGSYFYDRPNSLQLNIEPVLFINLNICGWFCGKKGDLGRCQPQKKLMWTMRICWVALKRIYLQINTLYLYVLYPVICGILCFLCIIRPNCMYLLGHFIRFGTILHMLYSWGANSMFLVAAQIKKKDHHSL